MPSQTGPTTCCWHAAPLYTARSDTCKVPLGSEANSKSCFSTLRRQLQARAVLPGSGEPVLEQQHSNSAATADTRHHSGSGASPSSQGAAGSRDPVDRTEPAELREAAVRCRQLWEEDEWVELHPRWPLTNRVHARAQAAVVGRPKPQGLKRKRLHRSLTELTAEALATRAQRDAETVGLTAASLSR